MAKIEIKYQSVYRGNGWEPGITLGVGLPPELEKAKAEYEAMIVAMDAFIKKVDSIPSRKVMLNGGLELHTE